MSNQEKKTNAFDPQQAEHFDLINAVLELTDDEYAMLQQNRFMVSDRLNFEQFKRAYAWIYWKDLPVLVTADAILHSIHQTYDELLQQIEMTILTEKLIAVLTGARDYLRENPLVFQPHLSDLERDLDLYLSLPLYFLSSRPAPEIDELAKEWVEQIQAANADTRYSYDYDEDGKSIDIVVEEAGIRQVTLFGLTRDVDFSQFRVRGHYDEPAELVNYFRAMMWLQLIDFRLVEYNAAGKAILQRGQLAAAFLLAECLAESGQQITWQEIEELLSAFVGWSDNITLNGLQQFFNDAGIKNIDDCFTKEEPDLMRLLTEKDYGQQQIRGQYQQRNPNFKGELKHNISFNLLGQRYTIESDIMQQLVYDKLTVDGKSVPRPFPSPFDVLYALGNDHAFSHLDDELNRYGYAENLKQIRDWVSTHSDEFWENSFYNHWLQAICTLGISTTDEKYPSMMRSTAWADKVLQTQLGSWTQLRHDHILYAKPPHSLRAICDYPSGYVEPYPELYRALRKYAEFGYRVFKKLSFPEFDESYEEAKARLGNKWYRRKDEIKYRPQKAEHIQQKALSYFKHLADTMTTLESLAEKELSGIAFDEDDNLFLRSIVVRKYVGDEGYGGYKEEHWDGWYIDLLPFGDESSKVVTDIHTNYNAQIGEAGTLHLGLDNPVLMLCSVDNGGGDCLYAGVVYTVRQHIHPTQRMTDDEWKSYLYNNMIDIRASVEKRIASIRKKLEDFRNEDLLTEEIESRLEENLQVNIEYLANFRALSRPDWEKSFRIPHDDPRFLRLPTAYNDLKASLSPELGSKLKELLKILVEQTGYQMNFVSGYGAGTLAKLVKENPDILETIDFMTEEMSNELIEILKAKGHL